MRMVLHMKRKYLLMIHGIQQGHTNIKLETIKIIRKLKINYYN